MNLSSQLIKQQISEKADEIGFLKIGFAKTEALHKESERLRLWLDNGFQADMNWIEKGFEKRKNVSLILENARTVISLAYNYYTENKIDDDKPKISRYAWGKDYHKVLKKKLKALSDYIEKDFNAETKSYVDDGPVMDKAWAVRAGVGWMGKHTNVIIPETGSYFFLCEIITDLELDTYDEPIEDLCGNCRACINACPTQAIIEPYKLDSNLCISYHTIENRNNIPDSINLDGWIFGCDVCQDICPFNRKAVSTDDESFQPKEIIFNKSKDELDKITEEEFNEIFSDSPIKRTKFSGWKRNLKQFTNKQSERESS